jgi:hypothetical protein
VDEESRGRYSTHVLGARAVEIVHQHAAALGSAAPLFLYLAFQSVHAPLQAKKNLPVKRECRKRFPFLPSPVLPCICYTERIKTKRKKRKVLCSVTDP